MDKQEIRLLDAACSKAEKCLDQAIQVVDRKFGQGYSKDYPVLTAAVLEAIALFCVGDDVAREIAASDQL